MKAAARRLLARAGLEVRRTGRGPRRTLGEVLRHAVSLGLEVGTVVDVGVAGGTPELYAPFPRAQLLLVEPLAEWEPTLRSLVAGRGRYVVAAAGPEPGEREMRVHRVPQLSSLRGEHNVGLTTPRTVRVVTLDEAVDGMPGPYLVKVDVEGGELDALAGASRTLERTELVIAEASLFELIPGQPLVHDVIGFLADRGFVLYDLYDLHTRPLDRALAMVDLVFARRDGVLRSSQRFATEAQADALYRSWGY